MNKNISSLMEKTNKTELECEQIWNIVNSVGKIGRKHKEKIIQDFMNSLHVTEMEADELYNICSEITTASFFSR